jgi:antitoxin FitA
MPSLQVRDCPPHIYQALQEMADREHRSLAQEIVVVLARGLQMAETPKDQRLKLLAEWEARPSAWKADFPNPVELIREDRNR